MKASFEYIKKKHLRGLTKTHNVKTKRKIYEKETAHAKAKK
jgi:hypothetical protein